MKEFLNTLMIGDWVECENYYTQLIPGMFCRAYYHEGDYEPIRPVLLTKEILRYNYFNLVTGVTGKDDVYTKRVQEGPDNDEYDISVHFHDDKITQIWVQKVIRTSVDGEKYEWVGMLCHVKYVHTFQNLLNITGLKDTSEEFSIM